MHTPFKWDAAFCLNKVTVTPILISEQIPIVNFHLICTKYRMQIKRAPAYPGTTCSLPMEWGRGGVEVEVVNSSMGTKRETAKEKGVCAKS